jgi:hypothetical protein
MLTTIIWLAVGAAVAYVGYKYFWPKVENTPAGDAAEKAVEEVKASVTESVQSVADVNKDGKVDLNDAKEAVAKIANKAKKNVTKGVAKTAAKVEKAATKANKKTKKQ